MPSRPFLALDGEGITHPGDKTQSYVLLGASDGSSVSEEISDPDRLTSWQCLEFVCNLEREYPGHIKVGYGFNYDVNMFVADIPRNRHKKLVDGEWIAYGDYMIKWIYNKWVEIKHDKTDTYVQIFDVASFFPGADLQTAIRQYLEVDAQDLAVLDYMKPRRGKFTLDELDDKIKPYMYVELRLLAALMVRLRSLIAELDIPMQRWHGPGAIASGLMHKHKVNDYRPLEDPPEIREAAQYAYAGGRMETFRTGKYEGPVYGYDLRSAYPYALTQCPALTDQYHHDTRPAQGVPVAPFTLCHVRYLDYSTDRTGINPLPLRTSSGALYYPNFVETWCWGPEYNVTLKHRGRHLELLETVAFEDDGRRPFQFLEPLYQRRLRWAEQQHPAQLVIKTGTASMYGKTAQRVGWDQKTRTPPRWHQLRWAGYTTSICRAAVFDAMMQAPDRQIAVETDGIFSEVPLDLTIGDQLGEWKAERYEGILYAQSGVYFTEDETGGWSVGKTRGFSSNKTHAATALESVATLTPMETYHTRFHGLRGSIGQGEEDWRSWQQHKHEVSWGGDGKRYHDPQQCAACDAGELWHRTMYALVRDPKSHKHALPWLGERNDIDEGPDMEM